MRSVLSSRLIVLTAFAFLSTFSVASAEEKVVATIKPVHSLVAQVMGNTGTPELIITSNASPHSYVLKPSDAGKLASATIIFRMSAAIEPFSKKAARTLSKSTELVSLQDAPSLVALPQRAGGPFDAHDHEHDHEHSLGNGGHAASDSNVDGHVWLDPENAKAMLDEIARRLARRNPTLATTYVANAAAAKARLEALSSDIEKQLAPVAGRPYVVFHDAYQYFEKRFGLRVVGSITVNPDVPPSGKRLSGIRERILSLKAVCVFSEPNFDSKVTKAVSEGSAAKSGALDPEGTSLPAGPDLYEKLMRNMSSELVRCLSP